MSPQIKMLPMKNWKMGCLHCSNSLQTHQSHQNTQSKGSKWRIERLQISLKYISLLSSCFIFEQQGKAAMKKEF